ncbi:CPBP family intramembrane glutamic endopeptidase [Gracilibacillus salinarum]|uniref:CPBP family intramembrane metalloprotease n=1 Tax=Gracilibacillus salinarum TaxID=2932255 RepID=A0ABY4GH75_9BACI|nr:CPBP family intramembrane glutamic endopeptidase [Gracilibacillus salinarum]UOQ83496.1 CPBP family intramembrane metalloprotease [Gracilibacillus salinarum]
MDSSKFRFSRLLCYFVLVSLFLFVSGNLGQYLIENQGANRQIAMLLQGVIFTGATLFVLFILNKRNPGIIRNIGLKGSNSSAKRIVGISLPFILLVSGVLTAYVAGGIENVSLHVTPSVIIAILINTLTAFMYEAFPEEIFIRGLIVDELQKKYRFIISLFLQPFIFICVPITVMSLESIFFSKPFALTIDYFILLFAFGIALQLYRKYTGTLWMSIIFHIVYLEVARYISMGGVYDPDVAILTFDEMFAGFMSLYLSFLFIVVLSIVVLSVLLIIDKRKN